ncbi:hypothetical protein QNH48_28450 [Neobacillus sp. YX16]|uniref:hypothetical protein n=1 Tax=Neobacillus sp. YX16 TaxID=3047874 RepID=UPI0024C2257D|nr:hypothetical protein [Neobacillus sp. YX16]WHZ02805.1 hypothetical protein QNH48_28450 [Neobacillus sp. YX16]
MKMKKGLLLVVLLLAMSSVMAAMSYNKATVTNASELKIVNTDKALVTLQADAPWSWENKIGAKDKTTIMKDGELFFQFGKGINGGTGAAEFHGLQPNSEYQWNHVFTVRNKSAETVKVTVRATGDLADYITFGVSHNPRTGNDPTWGTKGQALVFDNVTPEVNSGQTNIRNVAVKINIPSGVNVSPKDVLGSIVVETEAK